MLAKRQFPSAFAIMNQARTEDEHYFEAFIKAMDREISQLGSFQSAYLQKDITLMDAMTEAVLLSQSLVCSMGIISA